MVLFSDDDLNYKMTFTRAVNKRGPSPGGATGNEETYGIRGKT